jgi:hypothetical protein
VVGEDTAVALLLLVSDVLPPDLLRLKELEMLVTME